MRARLRRDFEDALTDPVPGDLRAAHSAAKQWVATHPDRDKAETYLDALRVYFWFRTRVEAQLTARGITDGERDPFELARRQNLITDEDVAFVAWLRSFKAPPHDPGTPNALNADEADGGVV